MIKKVKNISISAGFLVLTAFPLATFAQVAVPIKDIKQNTAAGIKDIKKDVRAEAQTLKQNIQDEKEKARIALQQKAEEMKGKAEELKQDRETKREEIKQKAEEAKRAMEAKREEAKVKIEAAREAAKAKIAKIKDERKKAILEKAFEQLNKINADRMNHFTSVVNQTEKVLEKVRDRVIKAETNGRDVSAVKTRITAAQTAISTARAAIAAQIGKSYTINITTENALHQKAKEARDTLRADLEKVRETVFAAREAVHKVATNLAQIPKIDEPAPAATTTPPNTPPATTTATTTNGQ